VIRKSPQSAGDHCFQSRPLHLPAAGADGHRQLRARRTIAASRVAEPDFLLELLDVVHLHLLPQQQLVLEP
jgi:hypothetical protein